jgi:hypothetical protein
MILGLFVYRMPYDEVAGIVAGACGNPAILAYSNKLAPTDRPDIGYAMIFPGMTIVKILFVSIAARLLCKRARIAVISRPDSCARGAGLAEYNCTAYPGVRADQRRAAAAQRQ